MVTKAFKNTRAPDRPAVKESAATSSKKRAPLTITIPDLLVDGSDAAFRRLVHNLFAFASRHEAMRAGYGAFIGLTGIEYTFLISVRHLEHDGSVGMKQLADHLHLSGPFATTMVGKLIKRGLILKKEDPNDRRRVCLHVTEIGHTLLSELAPLQRQVNDVQFGCMNKAEFLQLSSLLERLIDCGDKALTLQSYLVSSSKPSTRA